jgi:hypothetical protein
LGSRIDGIMPIGIFRGGIVTIDYLKRRVTISQTSTPLGDLVFSYPTARPSVRFETSEGSFWALVDTGNTSAFLFPQSLLDSLGYEPDPSITAKTVSWEGAETHVYGRLSQDLRLGTHRLILPLASRTTVDDVATVGAPVLRNFVLRIDARNRKIGLQAPSPLTIEALAIIPRTTEGD